MLKRYVDGIPKKAGFVFCETDNISQIQRLAQLGRITRHGTR